MVIALLTGTNIEVGPLQVIVLEDLVVIETKLVTLGVIINLRVTHRIVEACSLTLHVAKIVMDMTEDR